MNLNQLVTFYHAAQEMNFSRAASKLNVTQPAVSTQVRLLEEYLGIKLFARLGKKLVLTEPGEVLLGYAKKIIQLGEHADKQMQQMRMVRRGTLKLGSARTYARHILPPLLAGFQNRFPLVNIVLREGSSRDMTESLRNLEVEVALLAEAGGFRNIDLEFYKSEDLVLILPKDHELAFQDEVSAKRLHNEPFIMREKGSGTRRVVANFFKRHRIAPKVVFEASNAEVIKEQVARGVGLSILTRSAVYKDVISSRLSMANLAGPKLKLEIFIAMRAGHDLSQPARMFLSLLKELRQASPAASAIKV
jgi:DNA-binding transcriptional LysR family regulator